MIGKSMTNLERNFYEILNAKSTASFKELKSNYKQLILQFHPDKYQQQLQQQQQQSPIETNNMHRHEKAKNIEFLTITEAWNCLKDPIKRKQYDAEQMLNKFHTHYNIYAHLKLHEMKKQTNNILNCYDEQEEEEEEGEKNKFKESVKDKEIKYFYTYDCRCGGQYIVDDESAEQYCRSGNNFSKQINKNDNNNDDDADNKSGNTSTTQNNKNVPNINNYGGSIGDGDSGGGSGSEGIVKDNNDDDESDDDDVDEEGGGELIVECSECSLVIILNV